MEFLNWDISQLSKEKDAINFNYEDLKIRYYALVYQQKDSIVEISQSS